MVKFVKFAAPLLLSSPAIISAALEGSVEHTETTRERNKRYINELKMEFEKLTNIQTTYRDRLVDFYKSNHEYTASELGFVNQPDNPHAVVINYRVLLVNQNGSLVVNVILQKGQRQNVVTTRITIGGFKTRIEQLRQDIEDASSVANSFITTQTTSWQNRTHWTIGQNPTREQLGIQEPSDKKGTRITYQVLYEDEMTGEVIVQANVEKGHSSYISSPAITIQGFLTYDQAKQLIFAKLRENFVDQSINLDSEFKNKTPSEAVVVISKLSEAELIATFGRDYDNHFKISDFVASLGFAHFHIKSQAHNNQVGTLEIVWEFSRDTKKFETFQHIIKVNGFKSTTDEIKSELELFIEKIGDQKTRHQMMNETWIVDFKKTGTSLQNDLETTFAIQLPPSSTIKITHYVIVDRDFDGGTLQLRITLSLNGINLEHTFKIYGFDNYQQYFHAIKTYLAKFTQTNPFDLKNQINFNQTWTDVMKLVQENIVNNKIVPLAIAQKITWWDYKKRALNYTLKDDQVTTSQDSKTIRFGLNNYELGAGQGIVVYFKNIATPWSDYFEKIKQYLRQFNANNRFDLKNRVTLESTWNDVVNLLNEDMINKNIAPRAVIEQIQWWDYKKQTLNYKLINDQVTTSQDSKTIRFGLNNYELGAGQGIVVYFKNIAIPQNFYFNRIKQYLEQFTSTSSSFDLKNQINLNQTWLDVLTLVKQDIVQKNIAPQSVVNQIQWWGYRKSSLNIKLINDSIGSSSDFKHIGFELNGLNTSIYGIKVHFKNIYIPQDFFFERIQQYLEQFTSSNPFDLEKNILDYNTWLDVIDIIKQDIIQKSIAPQSIINKVQWWGYRKSSLDVKLVQDSTSANDFKHIGFTLDGKHSSTNGINYGIKVFFKNIALAREEFKKVETALKQYNNSNRLDIKNQVSVDQKGYDLVNYIKDELVRRKIVTRKVIDMFEWKAWRQRSLDTTLKSDAINASSSEKFFWFKLFDFSTNHEGIKVFFKNLRM